MWKSKGKKLSHSKDLEGTETSTPRKQLQKGGNLCLYIIFAFSETNDMTVNKMQFRHGGVLRPLFLASLWGGFNHPALNGLVKQLQSLPEILCKLFLDLIRLWTFLIWKPIHIYIVLELYQCSTLYLCLPPETMPVLYRAQ